jgi:hypothetical protein
MPGLLWITIHTVVSETWAALATSRMVGLELPNVAPSFLFTKQFPLYLYSSWLTSWQGRRKIASKVLFR